MADAWSVEFATRVHKWCEDLSLLSVDALVEARLISTSEVGRASQILTEEVYVRLCLKDYPPIPVSPAGGGIA
jgi:hypothetical protein